jgi:Flp pilus assembly protein TadG
MKTGWIPKLRLHLQNRIRRLSADTRGIAAVEFAMLVPLMLMIFFGVIQVSTVVAVNRKVSLTARTLSDLISQGSTAQSTDFTNANNIATAILSPYSNTPLNWTVSQVYVDPTSKKGNVVWSVASGPTATAHNYKDPISVPTTLQVAGAYYILSEVNYTYKPVVGFDIKSSFVSTSFTLSDSMFTRPRQGTCVLYPTWTTPWTSCPTTTSLP